MSLPPGPGGLSPGVRDLLAGLDDSESGGRPVLLARRYFLVEAESRSGAPGVARKGGVYLHEPTAALLLPSDFPPLARRRPEFARLRHVLVRLSFMLSPLPARHAYESARLIVILDDPAAVLRAQRPEWVTAGIQSVDSVTTEFSAALRGLVQVGADRKRVSEIRLGARQPVITAENRGRAGFGWSYQSQEGAPLVPRVEFALGVIELPRSASELCGTLSAEAVIAEPRFGVLRSVRAAPAEPPVPFRLDLGDAVPAGS